MPITNSKPILAPTPPLPGEFVSRPEAAAFVGVSLSTIDHALAVYPISIRAFGRRHISRPALLMLRADDHEALRAYAKGDRSSPRIKTYLEIAGVTPPASVSAGA